MSDALIFDRSLDAAPGELVQLSPRVARLLAPNPGPYTFKGTGVYIIGSGTGPVAVVDPGPDMPEHLAALTRALAGRKVSHILITHTHRDHSPAAASLKRLTEAKTYGFGRHPKFEGEEAEEGADFTFVPDVHVRDGDILAASDFTLECVYTPGHIANHVCYGLKEEKALFTGDHVMGWSTSMVAPPEGDMADYFASLEKLIARGDDILYPTHGSPIAAPAAYLRALLAHRQMRERQIREALASASATPDTLVALLYPELPGNLKGAAAATITAHLLKLRAEGVVSESDGRYRLSSRK